MQILFFSEEITRTCDDPIIFMFKKKSPCYIHISTAIVQFLFFFSIYARRDDALAVFSTFSLLRRQ